MGDDTNQAKAEKLSLLRNEHRQLDAKINALAASTPVDQLQIIRLKKRKLTLRDMIAHIEDGSLPDIIA
ncbi:MAG: YdcH family protein [Hyphomicrobiales bacterium]